MRITAFVLVLAAWMLPTVGNAQMTIDMSRITCAQYLALPPGQNRDFSAWMSGWFNYKSGYVWVDLAAYQRNVSSVTTWCTHHMSETVMIGLERATGTK